MEKTEGQICQDCHKAKYVKNPKTGKVFCADKCWTNNQPSNLVKPKYVPEPFKSNSEIANAEEAKWNKINEEKRDSMREMNAINNACLLLAHGRIPEVEQVTAQDIQAVAQKIYEIKLS